jgi:hypothetical protein
MFAVGDDGTILHYDGSQWSVMLTASTSSLASVWGSGPADVFTVGYDGTILHYDGLRWSAMPTPAPMYASFFSFNDVWGSGPNDVFAVGYDCTILHYDGVYWSEMICPPSCYDIDAVWGTSPDNVYAVDGSTIFHYDGISWSEMHHAQGRIFYDIWGSSENNVLAVGYRDNGIEYTGTALYFDGSSWQSLSIPVCSICEFISIWGGGKDDIFILAEEMDQRERPMILHYDGVKWNTTIYETDLYGIGGDGWDNVVAVGEQGTILHLNTRWSQMSNPTTAILHSGWGSSSSDVFAVGDDGVILHFDGNSWLQMSSPTDARLYGIWGSSPSNVFAVGDAGTILHYDGAQWSRMASPTYWDLKTIWGHDSQHVYTVGDAGALFHYDGSEWRALDNPSYWGSLKGVWSSSEEIVISGGGECLLYDGTAWLDLGDEGHYIDEEDDVIALWGAEPGNMLIVNNVNANDDDGGDNNDEGEIWRYNGGVMSKEYMQYAIFYDIDGADETNVFAVGQEGIVRYDGIGWAPLGVHRAFHTVWSTPKVTFVIAGGREIYRMMIAPR